MHTYTYICSTNTYPFRSRLQPALRWNQCDLKGCCCAKHMFCLNAEISHLTVQTTSGTTRTAASLPWLPSASAPRPPPWLSISLQPFSSFLMQRVKREMHEVLTYMWSDLSCLHSPCDLGLLSTWFELSLNHRQLNVQHSVCLALILQHLDCNLYYNTNTKWYILSI